MTDPYQDNFLAVKREKEFAEAQRQAHLKLQEQHFKRPKLKPHVIVLFIAGFFVVVGTIHYLW